MYWILFAVGMSAVVAASSLKGRPKLRKGDEQPPAQAGSAGETQPPDDSGL